MADLTRGVLQRIVDLRNRIGFPKTVVGRYLLVTALFAGGGFAAFQKLLRRELKKSNEGYEVLTTTKHVAPKKHPVNSLFVKRLIRIIKIIVPSWRSTEFLHLILLAFLLLARSILSLQVAEITGRNASYLVQRKWEATVKGVLTFAMLGVPASIVNSALRYETSVLSLRFRKRLGDTINRQYLNDVNFYKASHLGLGVADTDQRVTTDIEQFCDSLSNLYTIIFKPVLDVILFTARLSHVLGFRGPIILITYYFIAATLKRFSMPSFGKLLGRQMELEGDYRTAHQRLISNAEEIAFYDGSQKERHIITRLFNEIYKHSFYVQYVKAILSVFDSFVSKYGSSITGYIILALPIYYPLKGARPATAADLTEGFVRNRQLLINLSGAIAQIIVLSKKIRSLAGLTGRVAEVLEMVRRLDRIGSQPFQVKPQKKEVSTSSFQQQEMQTWLKNWKVRGDTIRQLRENRNSPVIVSRSQREGGHVIFGKFIRFENVDIVSPDGHLLVHNLTFEVKPNQNVMVMGPNGSGKSSLFRALGDLWPLQCGTVVKPRKEDILFVPQKPYLVLGTLRDQIIYPHSEDDMRRLGISDDDLLHLMSIVDEEDTILKQWSWADVRDWAQALSGGQKQRVAMARLFYHRPLFAILDECTSAVSDDAETAIYKTCKELGITLFTVSHRDQLRKYHDFVMKFTGHDGGWEWHEMEHDG
eukprot:TRINITY_DN2810_c0_g1_i1.p1 TRINITY_DN2810_c0_g1~~TRINITY_DN2810_c0_g1_i1.p1  ORF type:complete len:702 (-),score=151.29 TRINITY_DN2810_c0_g1_i1:24-2129(-)